MKQFLLGLILLISNTAIHAQVVSGAEVYYDKIGQTTYKVTAIVYRLCTSTALNNLNGYVIADTFKIPMNLKRISISKINDTCGNPCNNLNAVGNWGYEKHVFTDTINFSNSPFDSVVKAGLCQVRFAIHQKLRSTLITTHDRHGDMLYTDAMVNICSNYSNISSPKFTFEPKMSVGCNQPMQYTPGALDTMEFDSMGYELDAAMYDYNKAVTYISNFTKSLPMTPYCPPNPGVINCKPLPNAKPPRGVYFDSELCQFIVTGTKCDEIATIVFKVSEYRRDSTGKFKLLGYVRREMMLTIKILPDNNAPYISGSQKYSVCSNNKICFNSSFKDDPFLPKQTIPDTVRVSWNYGIPGASFTIVDPSAREKTTEFCWTTKPHYRNERCFFGVKAIDKQCNTYLNTYNYYIQTYGKTAYTTKVEKQSCGYLKFKAIAIDTSEKLKGSITVSSKTTVVYSTSKLSDSLQVPNNDTFYIRYNLSSNINPNCVVNKVDTVYVSNALSVPFSYTILDTSVCKSYPSKMTFSPSKYSNLIYWEWSKNDTLFNYIDSSIQQNIYNKSKFALKLYDNFGCTAYAYRTFTPYINTTDILPISTTTCSNILNTITPKISTLKSPIHYQWKIRNIDTFLTNQVSLYPTNNEKIYLKIEDDNHCQFYDSLSFIVNKAPKFSIDRYVFSLFSKSICKDSIVLVPADSFDVVGPYSITWKVNGVENSTYKNSKYMYFKVVSNSIAKITVTDSKGCSASDSIYIKEKEYPNISLVDTGIHCGGVKFDIQAKVFNSTATNPQYYWYLNNSPMNVPSWDSSFTADNNASFKLRLQYFGLYNCATDTTINVTVHPKPEFNIQGDTIYNKANKVKFSINTSFPSYVWSNNDIDFTTEFWAYELGAPGRYTISCTVKDTWGCSNSKSISFRTNGKTSIKNFKHLYIQIFPNPVSDALSIKTPNSSDYSVYSTEGKQVMKGKLSEGTNSLDVSGLSKGVYVIEIGEFKTTFIKE